MPKRILPGLFMILFAAVMAGCATGGGGGDGGGAVTTRTYVEDKERVDQQMEGGNFGYLMGTPVPEDRSNFRKTRRVYVVEVTKNPEVEAEDIEVPAPARQPEPSVDIPAQETTQEPEWGRPIAIPPIEDVEFEEEPQAQGEPSYVDYTVEKNDTLQKISKKFYDSYSKWPKIQEANKDVIKNPNQIKPGMTLRIPTE